MSNINHKETLVNQVDQLIMDKLLNDNSEEPFGPLIISISNTNPELLPQIQSKLTILGESKEHKLSFVLNNLQKKYPGIPSTYFENLNKYYLNNSQSFTKISAELNSDVHKIAKLEELTSQEINDDVLLNSFLLIGPMEQEKNQLSNSISTNLNLPKISLNDRQALKSYYTNINTFNDPKDFAFYLTSSLLSSLDQPSVVNLGTNHSIYNDPLMFHEIKKLISQFSNVIYLIPCEDKEESINILKYQTIITNPNGSLQALNDIRYNVANPCNNDLASIIIYTKDKTPAMIYQELITKIKSNKKTR